MRGSKRPDKGYRNGFAVGIRRLINDLSIASEKGKNTQASFAAMWDVIDAYIAKYPVPKESEDTK